MVSPFFTPFARNKQPLPSFQEKNILAFIKSLTNLKSVKWFRDESSCPRDWK